MKTSKFSFLCSIYEILVLFIPTAAAFFSLKFFTNLYLLGSFMVYFSKKKKQQCLYLHVHLLTTNLWLLIFYREQKRIRKWRKMIGVGGSDWKHYVRRKPHVVKRRIRKGIPDCLRGLVWQLISGSRDLLLMNPGVYEVLSVSCFVKGIPYFT